MSDGDVVTVVSILPENKSMEEKSNKKTRRACHVLEFCDS